VLVVSPVPGEHSQLQTGARHVTHARSRSREFRALLGV